ncbi:MAG: hypothetical protein F6K28_60425, partial [Microcoleus sp. SIO2G3]|nr:hypothetical protein [Microcoleus sp. SIO2G3]
LATEAFKIIPYIVDECDRLLLAETLRERHWHLCNRLFSPDFSYYIVRLQRYI